MSSDQEPDLDDIPAPAVPASIRGELVTETFTYDGGRQVTVYVPPAQPEAIVFSGDGQLTSRWAGALEAAEGPPTMIVGAHRLDDEMLRLHEYTPAFDAVRFSAHEKFLVEDVRRWARSRFGVALPAQRTGIFGVSAGGELALAMGLRHPDRFGAVFCASPGGGYRPPARMPSRLPRVYLVAGTLEPFFLENAGRWADALREAGADVVMTRRVGSHGDAFWREEFPRMVAWAFGHSRLTSPRPGPSPHGHSTRSAASGTSLPGHLRVRYGIKPTAVATLDAGVFRVDRRDGPPWVARVFPGDRPVADVEAEAELLKALEAGGFPAERCAHQEPVSIWGGRGVLVTEFLMSAAPLRPGRSAALLGGMLGGLHSRSGARFRPGGAWHHLSFSGGPRQEIAAARGLLDGAVDQVPVRQLAMLDRLREAVDRADDCDDLPQALVHPDLVPANAIPTPDERLVVIDWTGAGRGPRLWSLGFLLWAMGAVHPQLIEPVVSRYRKRLSLEAEEISRLEGAIMGRPLMIDCWSLCHGRRSLAETVGRIDANRELAKRIAGRARQAFADA